jgi:hypothetical protein
MWGKKPVIVKGRLGMAYVTDELTPNIRHVFAQSSDKSRIMGQQVRPVLGHLEKKLEVC